MAPVSIRTLRNDGTLAGDQLHAAIGLLVAIADEIGDDRPGLLCRTTLERLVEQMPDERLRALLDWWLVVRFGERSRGFAYNVEQVAPDAPIEVMALLRDHTRSTGEPCLPGLRGRRSLDAKLAEFAVELHHEQGKVGSQGVTWDEIEALYRPPYEALLAGRAASAPSVSMSDVRTIMREHEVRRGSDIWRKIERDWTRLDTICAEAFALAGASTSAYAGPVPERVPTEDSQQDALAARVERLLLRDILDLDISPGEVFSLLASEVVLSEVADAEWFAALTIDYCEQIRAHLPAVAQDHQRIRHARKELAKLERNGVDVEIATILLDEGAVGAAESAIEEARSSRAREDRARSLRQELDRLTVLAGEAQAVDEVQVEIELAGADIDDGELDEAADKIRQLREALASQIEQSRAERALSLIESIQRLGATADDSVVARVEAGSLDEHDVQLLEDVLDQAEVALRTRVEERLRAVSSRIDNEQQLLDSSTVEQLNSMVANARSAVSLNDLPAADEVARRAVVLLDQSVPMVWRFEEGESRLVEHLRKYVTDRLGFSGHDIDRLYVGLKTKRFAILSGLTGSGKSTIARLFAESLGASASNGRFVRIAVRPNWVDEAEVLGYVNPMTQRFEPGWMASLIRACERMPDLPVFCLLDEMNLAPVEYYLADYLSALEEASSGADTALPLYPSGASPANADEWPSSLAFPDNLFLIGTVNVDESTRPLSDRVLDRANVLQLSVTVNDRHHRAMTGEQLEPRWQVRMRDWRSACAAEPSDVHHDFLVEVGEVLNSTMRLGLGVRAHIEIERFVANSDGVIDPVEALDLAMLQRIIPKIRGFRRDLSAGIEELRDLCTEVGANRCAAVLNAWLAEHVSDDDFIDGTHAIVGLVASR